MLESFTCDVFVNLFSDAIFLLACIVLGCGWLWWRRKRLLDFFNVSNQHGLTIYLSRLEIVAGGAIGFDGRPRSFQGATVTAAESAASTVLSSLFDYLIPGLEGQQGILRNLFVRDVRVVVEPSPQNITQIPNDRTIIAVGSPGYNSVSAWIEQSLNPLIRFGNDNVSFIPSGQQPVIDATQGMVQVLWDANHSRRVFYAAGMSEQGTAAALLYLARKWNDLRTNLGNKKTYACFVRLQNGEPMLLTTIHPS